MFRIAAVSTLALCVAVPAFADEVNLYSSRHYDTDYAIFDAFTEATGITVNLIEASGDELMARIDSEGVNSPADLFWTVDAGRLHTAVERGMFQPIQSDVLDAAIPADLRHPDGLFYAVTTRARVIYYNVENGRPENVNTYEDLGNPDLGLSVCIRTSSNIYNLSQMAEMIEIHGEDGAAEWAEGLLGNLARQPQGGDTDQIRGVAAGECDLAVANSYYWGRLQASQNPADRDAAARVLPIFPNQDDRGTHVNVSGLGVLANAPNPENAVAFLEFLASPTVQSILADQNNEWPAVEGVTITGPMRDWADFKRSNTNVAVYGTNQAAAISVWDRVGFP
ncbi:extracellular solute-binding protein [Roseinatronobacter sp. NSM]|uniref:extracellular solute-binding protein n=1 Tax=Roseinatronobacter sp. NSM TaxID=3457785 RepID=UPI004035BF2F